nr:putative ribonuclease H-like domain-containing protein [Tanacetum cinerariifolium]
MDQRNPILAKILILDTGKFEQWQFRIQQYLQHEQYALWEVIEFRDSNEAPKDDAATASASNGFTKKKGRTITVTTEDMQKRRNDVKARTTLLLALPDEHQLRFSKYKTTQELWATILKTFGGNEATKKTKKNLLKQQFGNFKAEGSETLEQTFNRLQVIVSQLEFMDIEIEQDDLDHNSGKEEVNTASISTASTNVSHASVNIGAASISQDTACAYIASQSNGKKITIEGTDVAGFDKSKVECFNYHKMGHFARECRAPMSQDRGRRENYRQEENHALVADEEAPTEFALMAKTSADSEVFDNCLCSKTCLSQVKGRLVEFKNQEVKFCEKIRGLELKVEFKTNRIKSLTNELEMLKKEKGLHEFTDDTITDYSRPSPTIESNSDDLQNINSFVTETGESSSSILSKPTIKFVKAADRPTKTKTDKVETAKKPAVKYAKMYRKTSKSFNVMGKFQNNINDKGYWDSGCSRHMTCNISYLSDYEPFDGGYVSFGQGGCKITGKGTIKTGKLEFENVYFVKDIKDFKLIDDTNVLQRTPRQHNMYSIDLNNIVPHKDLNCLVAKASADECMLWHRRLGHLNFKTMNNLVRHNLVRGLPTKCFENDHTCAACLKGKQNKASCKTKLVNSVSKPIHTLHMNLFGPTFDETSGILRNFITEIENLKELKVKIIRCDNGREFRNKQMNDFCSRKGIKKEFSNARTPQQNRVAEKRNRTLIEAARTMLADAKLPVTFWAKAVNTACYVQNRVLGSLRQKGMQAILLGTNSTNLSGTKEAASQDVKKDVSSLRYIALLNWFHEVHLESSSSKPQDAYNADAPESNGNSNPTATSTNPSADQMETLTVETPIPTVSSPVPTSCLNDSPKPSSDTRLISKRVTNQEETPSLDNILTLSNQFEDILGVTTNLDDTHGVEADVSNMESSITARVRPIGIKWFLKNKKDERGIVIRNKTRIVAQRHTQEEGIDYEEVFAPVARIEAIRLFLAYASFMGFTVYQMDMTSAFFYGTINEEVYVMQPPEFYDPQFPAKVYKVEKAMYGLHQASRAWYGILSKYLLTNGFQRGTIDQTLFIIRHRGDFLLVQVYVDDIIFGSSNPLLCREFEALMHDKFQMSAMGELNFFLGLQVTQKKDAIFLSQDKHVGDILKKFRYSDVRSANTPMDKENPWGKDGPGKDVDLYLYRSMIGSLMYLTPSRPDIMFAVCACARHQVTPKEYHLYAVKRIFRYLKGHLKLDLWYPKESPFDLVAYSNSDYGGAAQDRKSTTKE